MQKSAKGGKNANNNKGGNKSEANKGGKKGNCAHQLDCLSISFTYRLFAGGKK